MRNWESLKQRYLQDDLPIRLGNLASNLARIKSQSLFEVNYGLVENLLIESKFFIEWTAAEAEIEIAAELVQLQIQLSQWESRIKELWTDIDERHKLSEASGLWSDKVLDWSGLLA